MLAYDRITAAEIAVRTGVTERTFLRHSPDGVGPLDTLFRAFRSVQPALENNRPFSKPRREVVANTPALDEREMAEMAALPDALRVRVGWRRNPSVSPKPRMNDLHSFHTQVTSQRRPGPLHRAATLPRTRESCSTE